MRNKFTISISIALAAMCICQPRPSARKTFATWNHYNKNSELNPAGLIGPVRLRLETEVEL